jgi:acyl carrier protein
MNIETFLEHFRSVFDETEHSEINEDTNFKGLEEWDSMVALSVIAVVDEEYNVKLTGDDIRSSTTVADIFDRVQGKSA